MKRGINHEWGWIQIELTDYCNLKCIMCAQSNLKNYSPHKVFKEDMDEIEVEFSVKSNAGQVFLIGEFNHWGMEGKGIDIEEVPLAVMRQERDIWKTKLKLRPGVYHYMFLERNGNQQKRVKDPKGNTSILLGEEVSVKNVGNVDKQVRGFMKPTLFKKIIQDVVNLGRTWNEFAPFWYGESLLHPDFPELVEYASKSSEKHNLFKIMGLHTNATLLEGKNAEALLDAIPRFPGISKILFSIDGATKETFEKIRIGADYDKVIMNIHNFIYQIKKRRLDNVRLVFQFIAQEENKHEGKKFLKYWSSYLNRKGIPFRIATDFGWCNIEDNKYVIFFRALDSTDEDRDDNNELHEEVVNSLGLTSGIEEEEEPNKVISHPCSSLFRSIFIQWNGEATVCCADNCLELKIGDFKKQNLEQIWHGEKITGMRVAHIEGRLTKDVMRCMYCPQWQLPSMTEHEIKIFLESVRDY